MATTGTITFVALYSRGETTTVNAPATRAAVCDSVARNTNRYVTADVTASRRMHSRTLTRRDGPNSARYEIRQRKARILEVANGPVAVENLNGACERHEMVVFDRPRQRISHREGHAADDNRHQRRRARRPSHAQWAGHVVRLGQHEVVSASSIVVEPWRRRTSARRHSV